MRLVKRQLNGTERIVLKPNASPEDLLKEAGRMRTQLGYDVRPDNATGRYVATHPHYRGKFVLTLEPE
jgi:hypothetical protein